MLFCLHTASVDFLEMKRVAQELVQREASSSLEDLECFSDICSHKEKDKTKYYDVSTNTSPYGEDEDIHCLFKHGSLRGTSRENTSRNPRFNLRCFDKHCKEINQDLSTFSHNCCYPLHSSSLPKNLKVKYESTTCVFEGKLLNDTVSDETSSKDIIQCFDSKCGCLMSRSVNVGHNHYSLRTGIKETISFLYRRTNREKCSVCPHESSSKQQYRLLQNELLSSLQDFPELDLLDKSSVNWIDCSCDAFLIPKFNFSKFYKPFVSF